MEFEYTALDMMVIKVNIFSYISMKNYVVRTNWKGLRKVLLMSFYNIDFQWIKKNVQMFRWKNLGAWWLHIRKNKKGCFSVNPTNPDYLALLKLFKASEGFFSVLCIILSIFYIKKIKIKKKENGSSACQPLYKVW